MLAIGRGCRRRRVINGTRVIAAHVVVLAAIHSAQGLVIDIFD